MKLRRAVLSDAAALAALEQTQPRAAGWGKTGFTSELTQSCARIWCAEQAGEILGFVSARAAAGSAEILNVAVHPRHTRKAIGRSLLTELLADLKRSNVTHVSLEVAQDNMAACALYKCFGFVEQNIRYNFYGPGKDGWIMGKDL